MFLDVTSVRARILSNGGLGRDKWVHMVRRKRKRWGGKWRGEGTLEKPDEREKKGEEERKGKAESISDEGERDWEKRTGGGRWREQERGDILRVGDEGTKDEIY